MEHSDNRVPCAEAESFRLLFPYPPRYFRVGAHRLHYVDVGEGKTLLLLHACPMWSFSFRAVIAELSATHRVIALDQMGFGLSDKPYDYDYRIEAHVDHLEAFVKELDLKDMTLLMHGRGTTIGMGYAVRHPDNIRGFITLNSMAFSDFHLPYYLQICRVKWIGAKIVMGLSLLLHGRANQSATVRYGYDLPFPDRKSKIAILRFIEDIPCVPEDDSAQSMFEIESALRSLHTLPGCIIWGMKDWLYTEQNLLKWQQYFPQAEVHRIARAGRYLTEDAPEEFLDLVRGFLMRYDL